MNHKIPIIDLEPWFAGNRQQRLELCSQIREVCHKVGFFYIINHGIPEPVTAAYLAILKDFFELPASIKINIDISIHRSFAAGNSWARN